MDALATIDDLNRALEEPVAPEDSDYAALLLEEASDLVVAYCGREFTEKVPPAVRRVVARMVSRALGSDSSDSGGPLPVGASQIGYTAGPFSTQTTFSSGSTDGGVWLTRSDKAKLRRWKNRGAFSIQT
ncbi:hypothetical protein [Corynebacterium pygosceleis]|uniref:hypothetical protein n=1 Tax=Corynebacterium pygosceleis TaxID=2800406 RepID=UPI0020042CFB|nr:hypothetical protein [Corynebacterium pygosceleis]MCK7676354.1 hypothetical protein [Corynebacterium pygosceleis]